MSGILITGSQMRVGFEVDAAFGDPVAAKDAMVGCLYTSGAFDTVDVAITAGFLNDYILIEGMTAFDFTQPEDIGGFIQGIISECWPDLTIKRRDPVVVESIPQASAGDPNVTQPNYQQYTGAPPAQCNWSTMSFGDYIACQTGFTKTTAVAVGIAVGLLALFAVGKATR